MDESVSFIGAGRVGQSLARLLQMHGFAIGALVCRNMENATKAVRFVGAGVASTDMSAATRSRMVFLTVPDDLIASVCTKLSALSLWRTEHVVIHCSGVLGVAALAAAQADGAAVLSLHPMQSVADPQTGVEILPGAFFGLEGCERGLASGMRLVKALNGKPLPLLPGTKDAYHAAAVLASNYIVALIDIAAHLMEKAGIERADAARALAVLGSGTIRNIQTYGIPAALTGPIDRGDIGTVARHLAVLQAEPDIEHVYKLLGRRVVSLARQKQGQDSQALAEIASLLEYGKTTQLN